MNVFGAPTCTFTQFLSHLVFEGSGATNESQLIWDTFTRNGINPSVALGFFHHESQCGTQGKAKLTKSWGNIRYRPRYGNLPYPVSNLNGFAEYSTFLDGARHFAEHLVGLDGTSSYRGLRTVEEIVPVWAPAADGNSPTVYIAAVNDFAERLSGRKNPMIKVLHVAGHLNTQKITEAGLCDGLDKPASALALRGMTGTTGEQDFTSNMAALQADMMNQTGKLDSRAIDCTYSEEAYITWQPDLVIAHHIHRDGNNRAMFAVPDPGYGFQTDAAHQESLRLMARVMGGYQKVTGIPVTQDAATLRMRQLYTWCYIADTSQALIPEYGNGNLDTVALFNADRVRVIAKYMTDCVLEHFNLTTAAQPTPPAPVTPPSPVTPTPPTPARDFTGAIAKLREVTATIASIADQLEHS